MVALDGKNRVVPGLSCEIFQVLDFHGIAFGLLLDNSFGKSRDAQEPDRCRRSLRGTEDWRWLRLAQCCDACCVGRFAARGSHDHEMQGGFRFDNAVPKNG